MHGDVMNAVPNFGSRIGNELRVEPLIDRFPCLAGIVRAKSARRRNGDVDPVGVARIQNDAVEAHAAGARLPSRP